MIGTGTYVGDGTNDRVVTTGLSGTLRHVELGRLDGMSQWPEAAKGDPLPGKQTLGGGWFDPAIPGVGIAFVGADFTVDNDGAGMLNALGTLYYWVAFSTSP